jgi:hypothetical protein
MPSTLSGTQGHISGAYRPKLLPTGSGTASGGTSGYDADALAFFTAASITDTTQKSAIDTLVTGLKAASLWTKMTAIYPFVGGSAASHAVNLKSPGTYDLTFNGTITHSSNGVAGNGTTGYINTGITPRSHLTLHDAHISIYSRTNSTNAVMDIGAYDGTYMLGIYGRYTDSVAYSYQNNPNDADSPNIAAGSNASSAAMYTVSRTSVADGAASLYRNSTAGATTGGDNTAYLHPNQPIYIMAHNNNGAVAGYSARQYAFASAGSGLNSSEVSAFYTLVQAYQTTLSRQV